MRVACTYKRHIALAIALVVVGALCLLSTAALANGVTTTRPSPPAAVPSQPAMVGAGRMPMAFASNIGTTAYIYTDNIMTTTPTPVTGSIQLSATDVTTTGGETTTDQANVVATFTYPANGSTYTVRLTRVDPTALGCPSRSGGVAFMQPMFGTTGVGSSEFPQTLAYVAVFGRATIMKDDESIATDQPVMALVTQGVHGTSQQWLSTSDPTSQEIHLFVPGSMMTGGTAVTGFPNGGFYIYWPDAALNLQNIGGTVNMTGMAGVTTTTTTMTTPAVGARGPAAPITNLNISLTDAGIQKTIGEAPFGLYQITLSNDSSRSRGLYFTGMDLCCTEYNRFSNILRPGQSQTFRFYFAPGKVVFKDFLGGQKTRTAYSNVRWGDHSSSIVFR